MLFDILALLDSEIQSKFMRIYYHNRKEMSRVAKKILRDDALVEDALQEAFLAIKDQIELIQDPESHKTRSLCRAIVRNKAVDLLRHIKHEIPSSPEDFDKIYIDESQLSEEFNLSNALAALPEELRDILLLRYDNGYSTSEIAKYLGMSVAQVYRRIKAAKELLKRVMGEE